MDVFCTRWQIIFLFKGEFLVLLPVYLNKIRTKLRWGRSETLPFFSYNIQHDNLYFFKRVMVVVECWLSKDYPDFYRGYRVLYRTKLTKRFLAMEDANRAILQHTRKIGTPRRTSDLVTESISQIWTFSARDSKTFSRRDSTLTRGLRIQLFGSSRHTLLIQVQPHYERYYAYIIVPHQAGVNFPQVL